MSLLFAGRPCVDPVSLAHAFTEQSLPTDWVSKANIFRVSLGREHGRGWCLLAKSDIDAIGVVADKTLTFLGEAAGNETPLQRITLVGAQCLNPGAATDGLRVYLCELADRRYHLARIPINTAYNVRSTTDGGLLSPTLNAGTAWTWAGIVQDLWTALGLGTAPAMPFTPDGTPENLSYWGGWAWEAVNDVMDRIGCAIRYWPVTDTFAFVRLGVTDSAADAEVARLASQGELTWNSDPIDPARAWRPQYVRVRFARRPLPTDGSSPWYTVDVSTTATGVASGTYVQIDDDASALGATGTPSNSASLATRAAERAADWLRKRQYADRPSLVVYRDYQRRASVLLSSTIGTIVLDDRGGPRTQTQSAPDGAMEQWEPLSRVPRWWPPWKDGFFARLTTASSGKWKFVRRTWTGTAWADDGVETSTFCAIPSPIEAIGYGWAQSGDRVWMWPGQAAGWYEFLPDTLPRVMGAAALTESTGAASWQRRVNASGTWGNFGSSHTDDAYAIELDGGAFTAKPTAKCLIWMGIHANTWEFLPVQSADKVSSTYYAGYVSTGSQTWTGDKTLDANLTVRDCEKVNGGCEYLTGDPFDPGVYPKVGLDVGGVGQADAWFAGHEITVNSVAVAGQAMLDSLEIGYGYYLGPKTAAANGVFASSAGGASYMFGAVAATADGSIPSGCVVGPIGSSGDALIISGATLYLYDPTYATFTALPTENVTVTNADLSTMTFHFVRGHYTGKTYTPPP